MDPDVDQKVPVDENESVIDSAYDGLVKDEVEEVEKPSTAEDLEPLVAVERWDKPLKDTFDEWGGLENGRNYQQAMLDYHTQQQGYHTKLEQDIAPLRTESEAWQGVFNPHQEFLMHNGLTPQDAARRGMGIMANIAQDPTAFALDILQRTNYDFASHGQDQAYVPPEVQALRQELDQLKQAQQGNVLQAQQREANELNQQIQSFASATDASGELLHPHYQAVEQQMAMAVHGYNGMHQPIPPLEQLYATACKQNPEIQAQVNAEETAKETARKAANAKKAKEAARRATGSHTGSEDQKLSQKDVIEAAYDKQAAA